MSFNPDDMPKIPNDEWSKRIKELQIAINDPMSDYQALEEVATKLIRAASIGDQDFIPALMSNDPETTKVRHLLVNVLRGNNNEPSSDKRVRRTVHNYEGEKWIKVFDDDPADWDEALLQVREVEIELRSLADVTDDKKHSDFLEQLADQLHAALKTRSEK